MTERTFKLTDEQRRYFREKTREHRARERAKRPKKPPKPEPKKPTKELRQQDQAAYQRQFMRWWRKNGPVRGMDPEGKDWAK